MIERIANKHYLTWQNSYLIGNELIDSQHVALFIAYNNLVAAWEQHLPKQLVIENIKLLILKVEIHFRSEEELMARLQYPNLAGHKALHGDLYNRLNRCYQEFENLSSRFSESHLMYIKQWLLSHTQDENRELVAYIQHIKGSSKEN